jgi:hypothetical protein
MNEFQFDSSWINKYGEIKIDETKIVITVAEAHHFNDVR